jgi:hypothetical protein
MSTQQTITYAKPDFIQKAQQDLLNSIADYIASSPTLPQKEIVGLSDSQIEAINKLRGGVGSLGSLFTDAAAVATKDTPDFLAKGQTFAEAGAKDFDPSSADKYLTEYQSYVIDEINRQADLAKAKAAGEATLRGAYGGSRAEVVENELEKARLQAVGSAQAKAAQDAFKLALAEFGQEQKGDLTAASLAPYFTSAATKEKAGDVANLLKTAIGEQKFDLSGISALLGAGALEQAAGQEAAATDYANQLANLQQPLQLYGFYSDAIAGLPSMQGTQIQQNFGSATSPFQDILGAGATILGGANVLRGKDGSRMTLEKGIMALKHGGS